MELSPSRETNSFKTIQKNSQNLWSLKAENCALLGYYAASSGNFVPTFRYNNTKMNRREKGLAVMD